MAEWHEDKENMGRFIAPEQGGVEGLRIIRLSMVASSDGRVGPRPNGNRRPNFDVRGFSHQPRGTKYFLKIQPQPRSRLRGASPYQPILADFGKTRFFNRVMLRRTGNRRIWDRF
jgi:hypothetical protein